jgi:hypothetical protein
MTEYLTNEEKRLVEKAREGLQKAKENGVAGSSKAFLDKCSSESGSEGLGLPPDTESGKKKAKKMIRLASFFLRTLFSRTKEKQ